MDKSKLAFGAEPSHRRYRLRLARYQGLAEALAAFVTRPDAAGRPKPELLDVGVGNGRSMRYCDAASVGDRIVFHGVDNSPRRLGNMYGEDRWSLGHADVQDGLPFPDRRFDIVVCEQVLEHVTNPDQVLREMARVLAPGGLMVIGVPIFRPSVAFLRRNVVPHFDKLFGKTRDHVQAFSRKSICRLMRETGELDIQASRGFRVLSGGPLSKLEDSERWYAFNRFLGRHFAGFCTEIQVLATKRQTAALPMPAPAEVLTKVAA